MEKKPFTIAEALNSETSSQKTCSKADKKSAGRKTVDQKLRRDNLVVCRLNEQEMEILKKLMVLDLASEYGTYIRKLILKEARTLNINN
ncbi:hypothetical protein FSL18_08580 [Campylobacter jejuni]|nr:hypothetical protein [Campylobacter jejuni]EAL0509563.1 hypothetical protein [Campylobacter jejuni]EAL0571711.1 hypothetical protein [Campylobacter jejuni]ECK8313270.1 hypothetical protein [Campylobacter jejuni]ECL2236737.1 hypothetical protein [Campylobacter jejuni]